MGLNPDFSFLDEAEGSAPTTPEAPVLNPDFSFLDAEEKKQDAPTALDSQRAAIETNLQNSLRQDQFSTLNELGDTLRKVQATSGAGDAATLGQLAGEFEKAGLTGTVEMIQDEEFRNLARIEGEKLLGATMQTLGLQHREHELPVELGKLRAVTQAVGILRHRRLEDDEFRTVAGASVRSLLQRRIDENEAQRQGLNAQGDLSSEQIAAANESLERLTQLRDSITDTEAAGLYRLAFSRTKTQPRNRRERAIGSWIDAARAGALSDPRLGGEIRFGPQGTVVNQLAPIGEKLNLLREEFGANVEQILVNETDNNRLKFNMGRLGWGVGTDGAPIRALSQNGVDFLPFVDQDALTKLLMDVPSEASLGRLSPDDQLTFKSAFNSIRASAGDAVAEQVQRASLSRYLLGSVGKNLVIKPTLGDVDGEDLTNFTPLEREGTSLLARPLYALGEMVETVWSDLMVTQRAVQDSVGDIPYVRELGQDAVFTFTGSVAAREETKGIADTITFLFKGLVQDPGRFTATVGALGERLALDSLNAVQGSLRGEGLREDALRPEGGEFTSIWERFILDAASGDNLQGTQDVKDLLGPEALLSPQVAAALSFDADKIKGMIAETPYIGSARQAERNERMSRVVRGYDPISLQYVQDSVGSIVSMIGQVALAPASALTEDPVEALLMVTGELAGDAVLTRFRNGTRNIYRNLMLTRRLRQRFMEGAVHAPAESRILQRRVQALMKDMTPDNHADRMQALRELDAVLEDSIHDGRRISGKRLRQSAKTFADEISNFDLGEPEAIAAAVAADSGVFRDLRDTINGAIGKVNKPGKFWDVVLGEKVLNDLEQTIDRTFRGGDAKTKKRFFQNVRDFVSENGRRPDSVEMANLLPDADEYDFAHFLAARDKFGRSPPTVFGRTVDPVIKAISGVGGKVLNRLLSVEPQRLENALTQAEAAFNRAAEVATDAMSAEYDFRVYRARMRRVLNVPKRTLTRSIDELDTLRTGLRALHDIEVDPTHKAKIASELKSTEAEIAELSTQRDRVLLLENRLQSHDPTQPFSVPSDFVDLVRGIQPETWRALAEVHPSLFGGVRAESLIEGVRPKRLTKSRVRELQSRRRTNAQAIKKTITDLRTARANPLAEDGLRQSLAAEVERLESMVEFASKTVPDDSLDMGQLMRMAPPSVQRLLRRFQDAGLLQPTTLEKTRPDLGRTAPATQAELVEAVRARVLRATEELDSRTALFDPKKVRQSEELLENLADAEGKSVEEIRAEARSGGIDDLLQEEAFQLDFVDQFDLLRENVQNEIRADLEPAPVTVPPRQAARRTVSEVMGLLRDFGALLRTRDNDLVGLATTPRMLAFLVDEPDVRRLAQIYQSVTTDLSYQQWIEAQLRGGGGTSRPARQILRKAQRRLERLAADVDHRAPLFTGEEIVPGSGTDAFTRFQNDLDQARVANDSRLQQARESLADHEEAIRARRRATTRELELRQKLADQRRVHRELTDALNQAENPPTVATRLSSEGARVLNELTKHTGVAEPELRRAFEQAGTQIKGFGNLGMRGNPFNFSSMPFWAKAMSQRVLRNSLVSRLTLAEMKTGDLANALADLTDDQKALLGRAQRSDQVPSALLKESADLRRALDLPNSAVDQLDNLYTREKQLFADTLESFREAGFIDEAAYTDLRKSGYDPRLSGAFERAKAVKNATRVRTATQDDTPSQFGGLRQKDPLRFKRDIDHFRVRVAEPDRILNKLFRSEEEALSFMSRHYGARGLDKGFDEKGFLKGRTALGDDFVVARPLGRERLEILDYLDSDSFTPTARLQRLRQMMRDYYLHSYVEALNLHGGLVLNESQYKGIARDLLSKPGTQSARFENEFLRLPNQQGFFGSLAGKYVHKDVLRAMNDAAENHKVLQAWTDGMADAFEQAGRTQDLAAFSAELAGNAAVRIAGGVVKTSNQIAKTTQILLSPGVWVANWTFNIFLDRASGSRVTDPRNLDLFHKAMNETLPGRTNRSPEFFEAVEDGVISGTIFDRGNSQVLGQMQAEMGLRGKNLTELTTLRQRRLQVLDRVTAAEAEGTVSADTVSALRNELASIDSLIDEAGAGAIRRMGRGALRFLTNKRDALGDSPGDALRGLYNHIDDSWKYAAYLAYRRQGMPRTQAAQMIQDFWQNYDNVPQTLNNLGPLTSMVTAFPWELARLSANYLTKRPAGFLGTLMMLPAINLASMSEAGVNVDRFLAATQQTGVQSDAEATLKLLGGLYFFNKNGELATQVDLSNMIPFSEMMTQRGLFGSVVDELLPPERNRDVASTAIRAVTFIPSSLVGNNPMINTISALAFNRDPLSKRRIYDEGMTTLEKLGALGKSIAKTYVPPLTPGLGRDVDRFNRVLNAGIDPRAGRLRGTIDNSPLTAIIKSVTGATVRSKDLPFNRIPKRPVATEQDIVRGGILTAMFDLGVNPNRDTALNSSYNTLVKLYTRAKDESLSPETRDEAIAEFNDIIQSRSTARFGGVEFQELRTSKEIDNFMRRFDEFDTLDRWTNLPIHVQAVLLAAYDRQDVSPSQMNELMANTMFTDQLSPRSTGDPDRVRQAIEILDDYTGQTPGASDRLVRFTDWLRTVVLPMAEAKRLSERINTEITEGLKATRNDARKGVVGAQLGDPEIRNLIEDVR